MILGLFMLLVLAIQVISYGVLETELETVPRIAWWLEMMVFAAATVYIEYRVF